MFLSGRWRWIREKQEENLIEIRKTIQTHFYYTEAVFSRIPVLKLKIQLLKAHGGFFNSWYIIFHIELYRVFGIEKIRNIFR